MQYALPPHVPVPQGREIDARRHRQLERAPEAAVHLHEVRLTRAVVAELDHGRPMPPHGGVEKARRLAPPGVDGVRAPYVLAIARGPDVGPPILVVLDTP